MSHRYAIITPCRNEATHLPKTIADIARQTVLPTIWVIVDDGSTDGTAAILQNAAKTYPFIRVVTRGDRGFRAVGPGVIDAFYAGLETLELDGFDFICKLDADLEIPPRYFETAFGFFDADPCLGNLSGKVFFRRGDDLVDERLGDENACGQAKLYRVACFKEIGGFVRQLCWDGIDGHLCRMNGWVAAASDDPNLRIIEQRPMGASHVSLWEGRKRWGRGKYSMGSSLIYVLAVSVFRCFQRPFLLSGLGILVGYVQAAIRGADRYSNAAYRRFLASYERRALLVGKRGATRRLNETIRRQRLQVPETDAESPGKPMPHRGGSARRE